MTISSFAQERIEALYSSCSDPSTESLPSASLSLVFAGTLRIGLSGKSTFTPPCGAVVQSGNGGTGARSCFCDPNHPRRNTMKAMEAAAIRIIVNALVAFCSLMGCLLLVMHQERESCRASPLKQVLTQLRRSICSHHGVTCAALRCGGHDALCCIETILSCLHDFTLDSVAREVLGAALRRQVTGAIAPLVLNDDQKNCLSAVSQGHRRSGRTKGLRRAIPSDDGRPCEIQPFIRFRND